MTEKELLELKPSTITVEDIIAVGSPRCNPEEFVRKEVIDILHAHNFYIVSKEMWESAENGQKRLIEKILKLVNPVPFLRHNAKTYCGSCGNIIDPKKMKYCCACGKKIGKQK